MTDYELHRIITAWLQVGAVVVAAVALMYSQAKARFERRISLHAIAHEGLLKFVEFSAKHPNLHLLEPDKRVDGELSPEEREIERSGYLLLILAYERSYRFVGPRDRKSTLRKIERLISAYAAIDQFREAVDLYTSFSDDRFTRQLNSLIMTSKSGIPATVGDGDSDTRSIAQRPPGPQTPTEEQH